jgi:hypothetical protein
MAGDSPASGFETGRANLRDTAKWMVSGIVGVAGLFVGASSVSQLGGMEIGWRFWVAVVALLIALGLCWSPFSNAIAVLRSEVLSLRAFTQAKSGSDLATAAKNVESLVKPDLPNNLSLAEFVAQYDTLRKDAFDKAAPADAQRDVFAIDDKYQRVRQACISELVGVRFDKLKDSIRFPGSIVLLAFLVFGWAANPAKDAPKLLDKPYAEPLTPARLAKLKSLGAPPPCLAPGAQLLAVAVPEAGHQEALLSAPACSPYKVMLSAGEITQAEPIATK